MKLPVGSSSGVQDDGLFKPTKTFSIFKSQNQGKSEAADPDFIPEQEVGGLTSAGDKMQRGILVEHAGAGAHK